MTPAELPGRSDSIGLWLAMAAIGAIGAMASAYLGLVAIGGPTSTSGSDVRSRAADLPVGDSSPTGSVTTIPGQAVPGSVAGPTAPAPMSVPASPTTPADCPPVFTVPFELNSAELDVAALELEAPPLVRWLLDHPEVQVVVEGHADALGSEQDNLALSFRRAEAVAADLVERGAPVDRLTAHGLGEYQGLVGEPGESAANRRVSFDVPGFGSCQGPGEEDS